MGSIGTNISRYRKQQDLTQKELAEKAGIDLFTLSKIETGTTPNPTIETMKRIADTLGVSVDLLMKK